MSSTRIEKGFNVFAYLSASIGLGQAARNTVRALKSSGQHICCFDIEVPVATGREALPCSWPMASSFRHLPYSVSLFHLNPPLVSDVLMLHRRELGLDISKTLNCGVPFWELPRFPSAWLPELESMDVVLAPTRFIKDAVERSVDAEMGPEVWHFPQAVHAPEAIQIDRVRWLGDRAHTVAFLCMFDVHSDLGRKNPWAAIGAFQAAFGESDSVTLLIKANNAREEGIHAEQVRRLTQLVDKDSRVRLLDMPLSRDDLWSMYASVDALVSLHRSEGLGLSPMEAMSVGKPVVATGWSGNMDFMSPENSMPVPYRQVSIGGVSSAAYRDHASQSWAEPDVDAAASLMRLLHEDADLRARLGDAAAATMRAIRQQVLAGALFDTLIERAERLGSEGGDHLMRVRRLERYADTMRFKRTVVRLLRSMGLKPPAPPDERHPDYRKQLLGDRYQESDGC